jgi:hypothetical protein
MIGIYCRAHHGSGHQGTCDDCRALYQYASRKIDRCPQHRAKPVCASCTIHCYGRKERDQIREVMRFSGPRMLIRHPALALLHLVDRLRRPCGVGRLSDPEVLFLDSSRPPSDINL